MHQKIGGSRGCGCCIPWQLIYFSCSVLSCIDQGRAIKRGEIRGLREMRVREEGKTGNVKKEEKNNVATFQLQVCCSNAGVAFRPVASWVKLNGLLGISKHVSIVVE